MVKKNEKRYGRHQKQTKPFLKTYLPYLPLLLILTSGLFTGLRAHNRPVKDVLAYATNVTDNSLLQVTNAERAAAGKPALKTNVSLNTAAQAKADDMVKRNYWAHQTPDGQDPWIFLDKAGYAYQKAGENLAYGFTTSQATVAGWMNSPSHKANILDDDFTEVGFGYANADHYQKAGQATIVVAMYGSTHKPTATAPTPPTVQTQNVLGSTQTFRIARIQILTNGKAPWSVWAILLAAMVGAVLITLKHSVALHRFLVKGERFIVNRPLLDITIIAFIALCFFVSRVEGYILGATF